MDASTLSELEKEQIGERWEKLCIQKFYCFIQSLRKYSCSNFPGQAQDRQQWLKQTGALCSWIFTLVERGIFETNDQVHIMCWVRIGAIKKNRKEGDTGRMLFYIG